MQLLFKYQSLKFPFIYLSGGGKKQVDNSMKKRIRFAEGCMIELVVVRGYLKGLENYQKVIIRSQDESQHVTSPQGSI